MTSVMSEVREARERMLESPFTYPLLRDAVANKNPEALTAVLLGVCQNDVMGIYLHEEIDAIEKAAVIDHINQANTASGARRPAGWDWSDNRD